MTGFSKVSVSAAGMTIGDSFELIRTISEQKKNSLKLNQSLSGVEGNSAITSGHAQQSAGQEAAKQTEMRAFQTGIQSAFSVGQEIGGGVKASTMNSSEEGTRVADNETHLTTWENKLSSITSPDANIGLQKPGAAAKNYTEEELDKAVASLKPKAPGEKAVDLNDLFESDRELEPKLKAAAASPKRAEALEKVKNQVQKDLKQARKAKESFDNKVDSTRQRWNKFGTAASEAGQTITQAISSASQNREADDRFATTQFDFLKDSIGRTDRAINETNNNLGQSISGILSGRDVMYRANETRA